MPKKITKVRWSASNVPFGVDFNNTTGTFTGTPEDEGEYTVPVSVTTNYGTATENVKININGAVVPTPEPIYKQANIITTTDIWIYANKESDESAIVHTNGLYTIKDWYINTDDVPQVYGKQDIWLYSNNSNGGPNNAAAFARISSYIDIGDYQIEIGVLTTNNYYDIKTINVHVEKLNSLPDANPRPGIADSYLLELGYTSPASKIEVLLRIINS